VLYFLDTNVLSEILKGHPRIVSRLHSIAPPGYVDVPIVAWFEIVQGRMAALFTSADKDKLRLAQSRLDADLNTIKRLPVRGIDEAAANRFEWLLSHKKTRNLDRTDLLIACIALAHGAILVTRNVKDFANVPGLVIQNWFD
jgi:tRNA(fMet)-specific endonuclease VapC